VRKLQLNTVWDISRNAPATDASTSGLGSQKLDGGAIYGIRDEGNRVGVERSKPTTSQTRGVEGATSIQWFPEQSFPCQTSDSGGFLHLSIANHGLTPSDVVSFRSPFYGETRVMKTNPTGFTVNGYLNRYSSGVTGVTYVVATPQTNPLTINHIEVWGSSAQTERSRLKVMNEDNIHSYMWRSGYFIYLGTRLDIFAKPVSVPFVL